MSDIPKVTVKPGDCIAFVIAHEGGYVSDPKDPGGETKYGISRRSYPSLDIANLTEAEAADIYRRDYWTPMRCDLLPAPLGLCLLDMAVLSGPHAASVNLQLALGFTGSQCDGVVGTQTVAAAGRCDIGATVRDFTARRVLRMSSLPGFKDYGLGWCRRALAAHDAAVEMIP